MPKGNAKIAVGIGPRLTPWLCNHQVARTVIIAPKAMVSPWAKFENLRIPYIRVTPSAPSAS